MKVIKETVRRCVRTWFLLLCAGYCALPFAAGLPGEYLVTQRWRDLLSPYSPLTNPAFLTEENYIAVRGCEGFILENSFRLIEAGVTLPVGLYESWGFSYFGENAGSIRQYSTDLSTGEPDTLNARSVSNTNNLFMFSYANNIWKRLSLGTNLNVSYQTNFGTTIDSAIVNLGGDVGLSYRLLFNPVLGDHLLGLTLVNVLAPAAFAQASYANSVKASWLAHFWQRQLEAGLDVDFKNIYRSLVIDENPASLEYAFSARIGAWIVRFLKVYLQFGSNYVGFSGGVDYPQINQGRDFSVLYQYMLLTQTDDASSHSVYVRADFGGGRAVAARKSSTMLNPSPNDLYNRALKLYFAGKHWDAFFVFSQIMAQYPAFFKNDWVAYYRSSCLEKLDMRELAVAQYKAMKRAYPRSGAVARADLGLMRLYYRDGMQDDVQKQYAQLNRTGVADSLKYSADYLLGQTYLQQKSFWQAQELFAAIAANHPDYLFAQYSLAQCNILANNPGKALAVLENCIQAEPTTPAQAEIQNRALLFMGYLYYEQKTTSKAITALRQIPKSSYYYEDALLGQGWTALIARQWSDCIKFGAALQADSRKVSLQCEGALIEGYGWLMLKNADQALAVLKAITPKAEQLTPIDRDSLENEHNRYHRNRSLYETLAQETDKISLQPQSTTARRIVDSLHNVQVESRQELARYFVFADEFSRLSFFSRKNPVIKNDIEYVLALVQKMTRTPEMETQKLQEKQMEQQNTIDSKIDKLKKQMQELDQKKK